RRETTAVLSAIPGAQELDRVGNDIHRLALVALLVLPFTPFQAPVDGHRATLLEVLGAVLALRAPHGDVEEIGLVDPIAGLVTPACVHGKPEAAHRRPAGCAAQLGVAREVAREDDSVDVGGCHENCSYRSANVFEFRSSEGTSGWRWLESEIPRSSRSLGRFLRSRHR